MRPQDVATFYFNIFERDGKQWAGAWWPSRAAAHLASGYSSGRCVYRVVVRRKSLPHIQV